MSKIVVVDCSTGQCVTRDMSPAEELQRTADVATGETAATAESDNKTKVAAAITVLRSFMADAEVDTLLATDPATLTLQQRLVWKNARALRALTRVVRGLAT